MNNPRRGIQLTDYLVLGIYVALALAFTWPAAMVANTAIIGEGSDGWQDTWEMWWMNQAIQAGSPPYHFATIYAPDGATNFLHSFNPIEIILTLPVQWAFGVIPAYNVACWMALFLTAFGGYLLGRDVTGSRLAGFVAGLSLGFAPHQFAQLLGHLDVVSIQFFVFCVWCLYRSMHTSGRRAVVWALWSAVCLAASALTHPYPLIASIITMLLIGVFWSIRNRSEVSWWRPIMRTMIALVVGLIVVSPLLFAMVKQRAGPDAPGRKESTSAEVEYFSADLVSYFTPSTFHPVWGKASAEVMRLVKGGHTESVVYPGYSVLGLALVGALLRSTRRRAHFWMLLAAIGLVLSLGPTLHILGSRTGVTLPSALFYFLPGASILRVPARFSILLLLGVSVCAALGIEAILRGRLASHAYKRPVMVAILLLVGLDLLPAPYPTADYEVEPWFTSVNARSDGRSGVLEVPFERGDARPQAWQIASGLPLAGGYMSRQPVYPLSSGVPPFTDFGLNRFNTPLVFERSRDTLCKPAPGVSTYVDVMRLAKVRYLVIHLDRLDADDPRIQMVARLFPTAPIYRSNNLIVYDTGGGEAPSTLFGAVEDTEDWMGAVEEGGFKWTTENYARIHFWSGAEREVEMNFKLTSFIQARDISISMGNQLLADERVDETGRQFDLRWKAPKGFSTMLITIGGMGVKPASVGLGNDERPLTVNVSECRYSAK